MQSFHKQFHVKQKLIGMSQDEVREVLLQRTFQDTLRKIDEIKERRANLLSALPAE